ncbi:MAG: AAA family ATPase [Hyphomicrobiaceae bacterium]
MRATAAPDSALNERAPYVGSQHRAFGAERDAPSQTPGKLGRTKNTMLSCEAKRDRQSGVQNASLADENAPQRCVPFWAHWVSRLATLPLDGHAAILTASTVGAFERKRNLPTWQAAVQRRFRQEGEAICEWSGGIILTSHRGLVVAAFPAALVSETPVWAALEASQCMFDWIGHKTPISVSILPGELPGKATRAYCNLLTQAHRAWLLQRGGDQSSPSLVLEMRRDAWLEDVDCTIARWHQRMVSRSLHGWGGSGPSMDASKDARRMALGDGWVANAFDSKPARIQERSALSRALALARGCGARPVGLAGPLGSGKSWIVRHVAEEFERDGGAAIRVDCRLQHMSSPRADAGALLRRIAFEAVILTQRLTGSCEVNGSGVSGLAPDLDPHIRALLAAPEAGPRMESFNLATRQAVCGLLNEVATQAPLLLVIENWRGAGASASVGREPVPGPSRGSNRGQHAGVSDGRQLDGSARQAQEFGRSACPALLARDLAKLDNCAVLITGRDTKTLVSRAGCKTIIELQPLNDAEMRTFINAKVALSDPDVRRIMRLAEGSPLFAVGMARRLVRSMPSRHSMRCKRSGGIGRTASTLTRRTGRTPSPNTALALCPEAKAIVQLDIERLGNYKPLAQALSILDVDIDARIAARMLQMASPDVGPLLEDLCACGYLTRVAPDSADVGSQAQSYRFVHPLLRRAVLATVCPKARTALHSRAADALYDVFASDGGDQRDRTSAAEPLHDLALKRDLEVARHLQAAGRRTEAGRAWLRVASHAERTSDVALMRRAYAKSAELTVRATPQGTPGVELECLLRGALDLAARHGPGHDDVVRTLNRLMTISRRSPQVPGIARALVLATLHDSYRQRGRLRSARKVLVELEGLVPTLPAGGSGLVADGTAMHAFHEGGFRSWPELVEATRVGYMMLIRSTDDALVQDIVPRRLRRLTFASTVAHALRAEPMEADRALDAATAACEADNDTYHLAFGFCLGATAALWRGELATVSALALTARTLAQAYAYGGPAAYAEGLLLWGDAQSGNESVLAAMQTTIDRYATTKAAIAVPFMSYLLADAALCLGRLRLAAQSIQRAQARATELGSSTYAAEFERLAIVIAVRSGSLSKRDAWERLRRASELGRSQGAHVFVTAAQRTAAELALFPDDAPLGVRS